MLDVYSQIRRRHRPVPLKYHLGATPEFEPLRTYFASWKAQTKKSTGRAIRDEVPAVGEPALQVVFKPSSTPQKTASSIFPGYLESLSHP